MNRESIYSALFAQVSKAARFVTVSRRLKHWSDVSPAEQPALFQVQKSEIARTVPGQPTVWELHVDLFLYAHTNGNPDISPAEILNPLLDSVLNALAPDPITNKDTLGGLVQHAWIEGNLITDEGVLGDQAVCVIPVVMRYV